MKEKLIIRNFGPIKDVELEFGKFNILIGEQATGKSTVAKVLAVCRYFSYIIEPKVTDEDNFAKGLEAWGLSEYVQNEKSYISYECQHYFFEANHSLQNHTLEIIDDEGGGSSDFENVEFPPAFNTILRAISPAFKNIVNELSQIKPELEVGYGYPSEKWHIPTSFFQNDVSAVLDNPFYIQTERGLQSIFSLGKNSIQNINDALFNQFAELDRISKLFKSDTDIEPLAIIYKNVHGQGLVKKYHDPSFFRLSNAASGYQSTIPIVLLVKYYKEIKKKKKTFILEEPELNLFPKAQQKLIDYLVDNIMNYENSILLTTHSPYILTSLNNLMEAYQVGQSNSEEVGKTIASKFWVNPDEVSAYQLLPDGTCEDIFDREEGLIMAEKIDSVSSILNEQFDRLLDIEFAEK